MKRSILFRLNFIQGDVEPRIKVSSSIANGTAFYPESLRCLSRARQEKKRLSGIDDGAQKNKRRASTPPRRVDLTERGKDCGRDEGCPRSNRSDPRDPSPKHRGGVASSIVTNCLVKEGPYMYKDRPPPPPSLPFPPLVSSRTYCGSKHNTRASRRSSIDSPSGI